DCVRLRDGAVGFDQRAVAERLSHAVDRDQRFAQELARRDEDLVGLVALLVVDALQLLDPGQARLALGAAALGVLPRPLEFLLDRLLARSEEHTSELQSRENLVCRLLLEKKKTEMT